MGKCDRCVKYILVMQRSRVVYHEISHESLIVAFSWYTHKPLYQVIENTVANTTNATNAQRLWTMDKFSAIELSIQ